MWRVCKKCNKSLFNLDLDAFKSHGINRLHQNCNNILNRELITHYFEFYPRKSSIIYNMKALNKIFTK